MVKIIRKVPQLQVIVAGLMYGMTSISYIAALLFLVYYIFGIVAVLLFKENDPFNFATLPLAILTLFRVSTLDGWSDIMCAVRRPADRLACRKSKANLLIVSIGRGSRPLGVRCRPAARCPMWTVRHVPRSRSRLLGASPTSSAGRAAPMQWRAEPSMQVHQHVRLPPVHVHG